MPSVPDCRSGLLVCSRRPTAKDCSRRSARPAARPAGHHRDRQGQRVAPYVIGGATNADGIEFPATQGVRPPLYLAGKCGA